MVKNKTSIFKQMGNKIRSAGNKRPKIMKREYLLCNQGMKAALKKQFKEKKKIMLLKLNKMP